MYKQYTPYNDKTGFKYLIEVAKKGTELLSKDINMEVLQAWQDYVKSILKIVSKEKNYHLYMDYLNFTISIMPYSPYEQLKLSIEKILSIARYI